jgi:hypothetical protein
MKNDHQILEQLYNDVISELDRTETGREPESEEAYSCTRPKSYGVGGPKNAGRNLTLLSIKIYSLSEA